MTVNNFDSEQSSKLLMKRSCTISIRLFIKIYQKLKATSCKVKISLLDLSCTPPNDASCYTFVR